MTSGDEPLHVAGCGRIVGLLVALVLLTTGCGGAGEDATAATGTATDASGGDASSSSDDSSVSTSPTDADTRDAGPSALDQLLAPGYGLSQEWVVETIVADIPGGTGGIPVTVRRIARQP